MRKLKCKEVVVAGVRSTLGGGVRLFSFSFPDSVSLWSSGRARTHCVAEDSLKLAVTLLPLPPECWDHHCVPPRVDQIHSWVAVSGGQSGSVWSQVILAASEVERFLSPLCWLQSSLVSGEWKIVYEEVFVSFQGELPEIVANLGCLSVELVK